MEYEASDMFGLKTVSPIELRVHKLEKYISLPRNIQYGVPHGSVLFPILFLIYINDFLNVFPELKTITFADDTTLFIASPDLTFLTETANHDLRTLCKWCIRNRLTIHSNKTYYMLFTNKTIRTLPPLSYNDNVISVTKQHTLLGVTFDDTMSLKPHIT